MKKIIQYNLLILFLLSAIHLSAQKINTFKGIVIIEMDVEGQKTQEVIKIMGNKQCTSTLAGSKVITGFLGGNIVHVISDYSILYDMFREKYDMKESGRMYYKDVLLIDENTLSRFGVNVEYLPESKRIQGLEAKKMNIRGKDIYKEIIDIEIWYTEEIGPEYNPLSNIYIKGFPLEEVHRDAKGNILYTKTTLFIQKGKVKKVEFLVPVEYEELTKEEYYKSENFLKKTLLFEIDSRR